MTWQTNLYNNLLVAGVLLTLAVIIYCKVTGRTPGDLLRDLREGFSPNE